MKNTGRIMAIAMAVSVTAGAITGCKDEKRVDTMEFESYSISAVAVDSTNFVDQDSSAAYWEIQLSGVLPVAGENVGLQQLRDTLERLAMVKRDKSQEVKPVYSGDMRSTDLSLDSVDTGNSLIDRLSVVLMNPKVIVWEDVTYQYYYRAAHGMTVYRYVNYDVKHNKMLTLGDLMVKNYREALTGMLREKLKDYEGLLVDVNEIEIPDNFQVTTDGLQFVWDVYDIAPYAAGEVRVDLMSYELDDILSPLGKELLL